MKKNFGKIIVIVLFLALIIFMPRLDAQTNKHLVSIIIDKNGNKIGIVRVPGPPTPPNGIFMKAVNVKKASMTASIKTISDVPAYNWSFGCTATSAAMMAGYYDNTGYFNMYAGPTMLGVMPMDNGLWGDVWINGELRHQCPLSATRNGLDGRTTRGHVDDYWISYLSGLPDPYITNGWVQHTYGECTGDYMKTNQSAYGNDDGATTCIYYVYGQEMHYTDLQALGVQDQDGGYGLKLFYESRGYTVTEMYNQTIMGYDPNDNPDLGPNTTGFTYAQYKQEIDADRPVLIHLEGHTVIGFGYNDVGDSIYIHDTWDYNVHAMQWGGYYAGLAHWCVTVIHLDPIIDVTPPTVAGTPTDDGVYISPPNVNFYWTPATDNESGVVDYHLQVGTTPGSNNVFDQWVGSVLTYTVTALHWQTVYAKVRAKNGLKLIGPWSGNSDGIIIDTPPIATNPAITPSDPLTDNDLVANYTYYDADGDPETGSEICWYKNSVHQPAYDDLTTLPSSATAKCQNWYFTVKPFDGMLYGSITTSPAVHIGNTPPTASNLSISPTNPLDTQDLLANYAYYDADGDPQSGSVICWYKNGVHQPAYDNINPLPASATTASEYWYFTVKPYDGEDFGTEQTSPQVPIDMLVVIEAENMQGRITWYGNPCTDGWRLRTQNQPIYENVTFPTDFRYHFTVTAKGEMAGDAAPWLKAQLGSMFKGTCEITSTAWDDYSFITSLTAGTHQLSLTFLNDWWNAYGGDRNLLLDKVVIRCQFDPLPTTCFTYEAEKMSQQNYTDTISTINYAVLYQYYSYVAHNMFFEQPVLDFEIIARADFASGGWPDMELWIGSNVQSVTVNNASPTPYTFHITGITAGEYCVKIDYKNSSHVSGRKLYIDKLIIHTVDGGLLKPESNEPIGNEEDVAAIPEKFALSQNYPNPFNPETNISFQLPEESYVVLKIFNLLGKEVKTLVDENKPAGYHTVQWGGRDSYGNKLVSGLYLYQIKAGNFSCIKKMALMK